VSQWSWLDNYLLCKDWSTSPFVILPILGPYNMQKFLLAPTIHFLDLWFWWQRVLYLLILCQAE
jgi:hypothetical protein